ncbi:MAG TPA: ArsA-related P-loop ATPase, partial [Nitrososphaera sp.]|nr:ArsA-related P-loop ATPase [Nitrososphaera sp.]
FIGLYPLFILLRLIIYTGKGGTGKTVTSCATAIKIAEHNYKTLVISKELSFICKFILSHPSQFIVIVAGGTAISDLNIIFSTVYISNCGRMNIIRRICRVSCSTMTTRILSLF